MKKSLFIGIILLLTVLLAACGTETNQPNSDRSIPSGSETSEIQKTEPANGDDTEDGGDMGSDGTTESKIILNMNGTDVHAALYDNTAARAFLDLLPYTVTVSREADDLCGSVSEELASDPAEDQSTWAIGEIGWFDGWFTILCDNEAGMPKRTRTIIGKIDEKDIPYMQSLTGTVEITVDCDCDGNPAEPDIHDIGILASTDPVAIDQASIDLCFAAEGSESLQQRVERQNGLHTLEHAEENSLLCLEKPMKASAF